MMLEPLARAMLPEQASRGIKQLVLQQHLMPGDKLPSERELTGRLGVSRTVVRESLQNR
jgi:DNA-binding FadR family transcriptional regulator